MLSARELDQVVAEHAEQIARMKACLSESGRICTDREIALAWASYSDSVCASWLRPAEDAELIDIFSKYLPSHRICESPGVIHKQAWWTRTLESTRRARFMS